MKAVIWTGYGNPDVLVPGETEKPEAGSGEVLVRVEFSSVTKGDCETRELDLPFSIRTAMRLIFGVRKPRREVVLGQEFSGTVTSVGSGVKNFRVGDRVFGSAGIKMGAYAEYICVTETKGTGEIAKIPEGMDSKTAAVLTTGGMEALYFFSKSGIKNGDEVLINGAGGSIGTIFLQLAKKQQAHITAVDSSEKLDFLKKLGADQTIDYRNSDFSQNGKSYSHVFDVVGRKSFTRSIRALNKKGIYLLANPTFPKMLAALVINIFSSGKIVTGASDYSRRDLEHLAGMVSNGEIRIFIDREYSFDEIKKAHEYVDSGKKKGNVVIIMDAE